MNELGVDYKDTPEDSIQQYDPVKEKTLPSQTENPTAPAHTKM